MMAERRLWLMDGTREMTGIDLPNNGPTWHVKNADDLNGDSKADIVWQNDDGRAAVWLMDGPPIIAGVDLQNNGAGWHIV